MSALNELSAIYTKYEQTMNEVCIKTSPLARAFGFGMTPRNHPCNTEFYEGVSAWVSSFLASDPCEQDIYAATRYILAAAAEGQNNDAYWYMYAAQNHAKELIPLLTPDHRKLLRSYYDDHYPKADLLPAQKEIYGLLCK